MAFFMVRREGQRGSAPAPRAGLVVRGPQWTAPPQEGLTCTLGIPTLGTRNHCGCGRAAQFLQYTSGPVTFYLNGSIYFSCCADFSHVPYLYRAWRRVWFLKEKITKVSIPCNCQLQRSRFLIKEPSHTARPARAVLLILLRTPAQ